MPAAAPMPPPSPVCLGVVGTGYLGTSHAASMAKLGFPVVAMDLDEAKIEKLRWGQAPFYEPGVNELLRAGLDAHRLSFTTSYDEVAAAADAIFLCVGTPQANGSRAADLSHVEAAIDGLLPRLTGTVTIIGKSTVPAGTAERLATRICAEARPGAQVELAWNPEFLREGFAVADTLKPDRLVFGVASDRGEAVLRAIYAPLLAAGTPVVVTDLATAQLVKSAANAFLATKISFINAMAEICERVGGDVKQLSAALSYDDRIGGRFLHAGLGFGGGCLPKDIRAFIARAEELGVDQAVAFLHNVDEINERRRARMIEMAREVLGDGFAGTRVAVLGAAFKPNSDDIRDSPALEVAARILAEGASVTVYDPAAVDVARRHYPQLSYAGSAVEAARDADAVLHLTEWQEFRDLDPAVLSNVVAHRRIVDGRNALDPDRWRAAGWTYRALGRP
jgi:UDPglucose 6-dehydrogenase